MKNLNPFRTDSLFGADQTFSPAESTQPSLGSRLVNSTQGVKEQFFEKANDAIDAGLFWRGNLARSVRQKDFKGTVSGILVLSFILFLYVWQHMQVVKLSYEVQDLKQQKQQLTNEYYYLKYKMGDVNGIARVETVAREQLHMETPRTDQVVILDDSFSVIPHWMTFWKKTATVGAGSFAKGPVAGTSTQVRP